MQPQVMTLVLKYIALFSDGKSDLFREKNHSLHQIDIANGKNINLSCSVHSDKSSLRILIDAKIYQQLVQ